MNRPHRHQMVPSRETRHDKGDPTSQIFIGKVNTPYRGGYIGLIAGRQFESIHVRATARETAGAIRKPGGTASTARAA